MERLEISVCKGELKKRTEEDGADGYEYEVSYRTKTWLDFVTVCLTVVSFLKFSYADSWKDRLT